MNQHIGKLVGKNFKSVMTGKIYEVMTYLVTKNWYKCRYYVPEESTYYYCYLNDNELLDETYFIEYKTQFDKDLLENKEFELNEIEEYENKCQCGVDSIGGGFHSEYCPKNQ